LFLGWKESKQTVASDEVSETSSARNELTGKKTSAEGVMVGTNVREVM
jgi:hypothetical protein